MFIQNARTKYTISGEPIVRKEMYTNHVLMRVTDIPILSPIAVHTPNNFHSIKYLRRFIPLIYQFNAQPARLVENISTFLGKFAPKLKYFIKYLIDGF
jgi:hypothetical protein